MFFQDTSLFYFILLLLLVSVTQFDVRLRRPGQSPQISAWPAGFVAGGAPDSREAARMISI